MKKSRMAKINPIVIVGIIAVLVIVGVAGFMLLPSGPSTVEPIPNELGDARLGGGEQVPVEPAVPAQLGEAASEQLRQRVESYFETFETKDIPNIQLFYLNSKDTFVQWRGNAGVFVGSYNGFGNIRILLASVMSNTQEIEITLNDYNAEFDGNMATTRYQVITAGSGKMVGNFVMDIDVVTIWVFEDGEWMITDDRWSFNFFCAELMVEGTVFPLHWKKIGDFSAWEQALRWNGPGPNVLEPLGFEDPRSEALAEHELCLKAPDFHQE